MAEPSDRHHALIKGVREGLRHLTDGKPHLQMFGDDACILRFLRARSMDPKKAMVLLSEALKWRDEQKIHELKFKEVEEIIALGKLVLAPHLSKCHRPVLILREKAKYYGNEWDLVVRQFIYQMEMVTRLASEQSPDGKVVVVQDFTGFTVLPSTPLKVSGSILSILQKYYPDRLHKAYWWHAPLAFRSVYSLLKPFLDTVTRSKIASLPKADPSSQEQLNAIIDTRGVDESMGGTEPDMYDHATYRLRFEAMEQSRAAELAAFTANTAVSA